MSIETFSLDEVAKCLDCTTRWLTEQVRANKFPARKIARQWRFTEADVATIIALCGNGFPNRAAGEHAPPDFVATGLTERSRRNVAGRMMQQFH